MNNRELFIEKSARYMVEMRPDLDWNVAETRNYLTNWMRRLKSMPSGACIGTGGFLMYRVDLDDGQGGAEYQLVRSVVDYTEYDGKDTDCFDWMEQ